MVKVAKSDTPSDGNAKKVKRRTITLKDTKVMIGTGTDATNVVNTADASEYELPDRCADYDHDELVKNQMQFKTKQSENIRVEIILEAMGMFNRADTVLKLMNHVSPYLAGQIEAGLFEFTLIKLSEDENYATEFLECIYNDRAHELILNLDPKNKHIRNKTLKPGVMNGEIQAYYLAFMRPEQLHPIRWKEVIEKKMILEEYGSEMKVTDLYTCYKCRNKKCITTQQQTRSADEPMTVFVTCLVCYNTFTK